MYLAREREKHKCINNCRRLRDGWGSNIWIIHWDEIGADCGKDVDSLGRGSLGNSDIGGGVVTT